MKWEEAKAKIETIGGYFTLEQAHRLFDAANQADDGAFILEVGAFKGLSTSALACGCVGTNKRVITIDTFIGRINDTDFQDGEDYFHIFINNLMERDLLRYVIPLVGKSEQYYTMRLPMLDVLFIDGNHRIMEQDLAAFFPRLKSGGWLFMHDVANDNAVWQDIVPQLVGCDLLLNLGSGIKR